MNEFMIVYNFKVLLDRLQDRRERQSRSLLIQFLCFEAIHELSVKLPSDILEIFKILDSAPWGYIIVEKTA